jgi:hypothetical protein
MMQASPTLAASRRAQDTLLTGPGECALYGVIHHLEALGLQLQEIPRPPPGDPGTTNPVTHARTTDPARPRAGRPRTTVQNNQPEASMRVYTVTQDQPDRLGKSSYYNNGC